MDMSWRKSSYSTTNGGSCVEVGVWRKSSHSTGNGGECVEVGTVPGATPPGASVVGGCVEAGVAIAATSPGVLAGGNCVEGGVRREPSHSAGNGGSCVEVGARRKPSHVAGDRGSGAEAGTAAAGNSNRRVALDGAVRETPWRTSTHSVSGECVEAAAIAATVAVRDTKDNGHGPVLRFTPVAWTAFTSTLR